MASPDLYLGDAECELVPEHDFDRVLVRQAICTEEADCGGVLALDLADCPLFLQEVKAHPGLPVKRTGAVLVIGPAEGRRWEDSFLEYSFRVDWQDPSTPDLLQIPGNLPRVGYEYWGGDLAMSRRSPSYKIIQDELSTGTIVCGLSSQPPSYPHKGRYTSLVLTSRERMLVFEDTGQPLVCITRNLAAKLGADGMNGYVKAVRSALDGMASILGPVKAGGITLVTTGDRVCALSSIGGLVIECDDEFLRLCPAGSELLQFEMIGQLAGLYWGAGCKLLGKEEYELADAISAGVALAWANESGMQSQYQESMRKNEWMSSRSRVMDVIAAYTGQMRPRYVGRSVLAFHEQIMSPAGRRLIVNTTADCWGRTVPASICQRVLHLDS